MSLLRLNVNQNPAAIIFVHGLGGSKETFTRKLKPTDDIDTSDRWADKMAADEFISNNFDIYVYDYHTNIFEFSFARQVLSLLPFNFKKSDFNVGLFRISADLKGTIEARLTDYKSLFFITHSMGGIVVKKMLTLQGMSTIISKVALYASLSVPHLGANLASIGKKLIANPQLRDLSVFGDFIDELVQNFNSISIPSFYQAGNFDEVVPPAAAIPASVKPNDRINTSTNHFSILRVNEENNAFMMVKQRLEKFIALGSPNSKLLRNVNFSFGQEASFRKIVFGVLDGLGISPQFENLSESAINATILPTSISDNVLESINKLRFHTKQANVIPDLEFYYDNNILRISG
ncbi:MAG: hypothetical protein AAFX87_27905 [Bacteroidota bacterium]